MNEQITQQQERPKPAAHLFSCEICQHYGAQRSAFGFAADDLPLCPWHYRLWLRSLD